MTSAQRARLVVALGVLNLVLATLALAVGISAPTLPIPGVAAAPSSTPAGPVSLPPVETPPPLRTPSPEPTEPAATPSAPATPEATQATEPTVIPVPTGVVIVAIRPPATPDPTVEPTTPASVPDPTARPNPTNPPKPTVKPPKPPPTPKPAAKPQAHPPCPGSVDGPPGLNKGQPWEKPCGKGNGGDKGNGNTQGGVIIVLPLALSAAALGGRRRINDTLRRRPSAR